MKRTRYLAAICLGFALLLASCAPAAAPAPTKAPTPLATTPPPVSAPTPNSQDEAWAKVVSAAKREGMVMVYTMAFVGDAGRRVAQDFENQYGIHVEILVGSGNTLVERVKVEQTMKRPVGDLYNLRGAGSLTDLVKAGLTDSIAGELPALRDKKVFRIDPVYSPGGEALVWAIGYGDTVINTKLVKPEDEPKSYNDLLTPAWKGKILSMDPRATSGGSVFFYNLRFHKALETDFYTRLAQQGLKIWGGASTEGTYMIGRGEFPILLSATSDIAAPMIAEGSPIKILTPAEGNTVSVGTVAVIKGAPHPNAARLFVNWLMSADGQRSYAQAASVTPIRTDVPDFIAPGARVTPKKMWARTWDMEEWSVKDVAAKTMDKIFGSK